jgi:hypothetical protein
MHAASVRIVGDGSTQWPQQPAVEITQTYEANGRPTKRTQVTRQDDRDLETGEFIGVSEDTMTSHYIFSSALGARVVDIDQANVWVYAGGQRIVTTAYGSVSFEHHNPKTGSWVTNKLGSGLRFVRFSDLVVRVAARVLHCFSKSW